MSPEAAPAVGAPETALPEAPMPEVAMPEVEAPPPASPAPAAQPAPLAVHIPREQPPPGPEAPPREGAGPQAPPAADTRLAGPIIHPHEEYSDLSTVGWAIVAGVLTVLALHSTVALMQYGSLGTFFWTAVLWFGVVMTTRMWLYRYHVRAVGVVLPSSVGLGSPVPYRLVLTPARRLPVDRATLLLRAEERAEATKQAGQSATTLRHERFRAEIEICRDTVLAGNQEAVFAGTFTLPDHAPPSFTGTHNSVLWTARVWVGMPGWRPDVRKRFDLTVLPIVPPKPEERAPSRPSEMPLPSLGACGARLVVAAPLEAGGSLRVRAGESVEGRLLMRPAEEVKCRRILLELRYAVASRGQDESRTSHTETVWEGDLKPGQEIDAPIHLRVPASGPITYHGQYFNIEWSAHVRVDIPMWTDLVATVPVIVEPAAQSGSQR